MAMVGHSLDHRERYQEYTLLTSFYALSIEAKGIELLFELLLVYLWEDDFKPLSFKDFIITDKKNLSLSWIYK